jgi:dienelactone hydrolase
VATRVPVFLLAAVGAASSVLGQASFRSPLPAPTGPYAIGRTSFDWIDESRLDSVTPHGHREVVVWLWYPATPKVSAQPAEWQPGKWGELFWSRYVRNHPDAAEAGKRIPIQSIRAHSYADAPVLSDAKPFPVLLFTPGQGELPLNYASLIEDLASHGYVVAGIVGAHSESSVYADGRIDDFPARSQNRFFPGGALADLVFALNKLQELEADSASGWKDRFNFRQVGAIGHSVGGGASLDFSRADPRVRAAVALDGGDSGGLRKPTFYLHSAVPDDLPSDAIALVSPRIEEFLQTAQPGYDLWLSGAAHSFSTDHFLMPYLPPSAKTAARPGGQPINVMGSIDPVRALTIVRVYVRTFFDRQLKGLPSTLLDGPSPEFPEVKTFKEALKK